jgi:ribonuclease PH
MTSPAKARVDGRGAANLRPFSLQLSFIQQALGSALVQAGRTRVICTASVEANVPPWLKRGGWITAEYSMLPGATAPRGSRSPGGRGKEIQRLIGRSLRACVDLDLLVGPAGPVSIVCDCDVIEADGGTRTAAITGAYVALSQALHRLREQGNLLEDPRRANVAAVSVGLVALAQGEPAIPLLDLCYQEDSRAAVDLNVVRCRDAYVELQGTAEDGQFSRNQLNAMLDLADHGIDALVAEQNRALEALS